MAARFVRHGLEQQLRAAPRGELMRELTRHRLATTDASRARAPRRRCADDQARRSCPFRIVPTISRPLGAGPRDLLQQREAVVVCPLQVVDGDDEWTILRQSCQQRARRRTGRDDAPADRRRRDRDARHPMRQRAPAPETPARAIRCGGRNAPHRDGLPARGCASITPSSALWRGFAFVAAATHAAHDAAAPT